MKVNKEKRYLPIYQPYLRGNEEAYVAEAMKSGWISSRGHFVDKFEKKFADYLGNINATTCANGTVALHLVLHALGIGEGDEVIVPALTYVAPANAIKYVGAIPVLVDSESLSWNIDKSQIESKVTDRTKAIIAVHLYGASCDMHGIQEICKKHGIYLIEDAAEAFGSQYRKAKIGTFGDAATFSFFGNKTITTGEGGMVVSKDQELIARIAYLKSQAVSTNREYWHAELGFNYRMTNICAAIGLAQLEQAERIIEKKREIFEWYSEGLDSLPIEFQQEPSDTFHTYWMVSILAEKESLRDQIRADLNILGVETRPLFYPVHTMPLFRSKQAFPVAEKLSKRGLNLPSFPGLSQDEVLGVCRGIKKSIGKRRR